MLIHPLIKQTGIIELVDTTSTSNYIFSIFVSFKYAKDETITYIRKYVSWYEIKLLWKKNCNHSLNYLFKN